MTYWNADKGFRAVRDPVGYVNGGCGGGVMELPLAARLLCIAWHAQCAPHWA